MEQTAVPSPPPRHPGRAGPNNVSMDSSKTAGIDQRSLHLWEHSVTLYHAFDWQAAAENFLFLSRMINGKRDSTLCLLNAAIIFARLGEYGTASQILADAEPVGETMPITMFVWGHVEFELGNFDKAEDSFKIALNNLNGRSQSYNHLGLDFTLKASHIAQDLRVFASRNNLYGFLGTLGALPADSIFVSPSTLAAEAPRTTLKTRRSTDSGYVPTLTDHSTPTSPAMSPVEGYFGQDQNGGWWQGQTEDKDVPVLIRHNSISEALEDVRAGFADLQMSPKLHEELNVSSIPPPPGPPPMESLPPTPSPSIRADSRKRLGFTRKLSTRPSNHIVAQSVDHSRHPAYQARDARVHGGETEQLADFILNLPPPNPRKPREAVVSQESTRDLAKFLRDEPSRSPVSPVVDDASVYSSDEREAPSAQEAVADRDLHRLAETTHSKPEPLSPVPRRRFRDGMASLISSSRPTSIHHHQHSASTSASTSGSNTPALTALPVPASTRSSSLRISPSNPLPIRKLGKAKPDTAAARKAAKKAANQPKMVPVEPPTDFTDFFPSWMAARMSKW